MEAGSARTGAEHTLTQPAVTGTLPYPQVLGGAVEAWASCWAPGWAAT